PRGFLDDIFRSSEDTMGVKLLQRMGWRQGQGIGPKVRRKAKLGEEETGEDGHEKQHLFAPENSHMIVFMKKSDHKGLGYVGEARLSALNDSNEAETKGNYDDEPVSGPLFGITKKKKAKQGARGSFGVGILNDTG